MSSLAYRPADPMSIRSLLNDRDVAEYRMRRPDFRPTQISLPPILPPGRESNSHRYHPTTPLGPPTPYSTTSSSPEWLSHRMSSSTPSATRRGSAVRAPRPKYSDDQGYFIWYHRTDLAEPWDKVLSEFERQFHHARPKGGLQCKFYRLLDDWRVEKVRAQARQAQSGSRDRVGKYGLVQRTNLRFSWMHPEHYSAPVLPQFASTHRGSPGSSPCPGCDECYGR